MEGHLAVAVSGGVDSVTLATFAHRAGGGARRDVSRRLARGAGGGDRPRARACRANEGWRLRIVDAGEFADANYLANPVDRCFFCKTNLYGCIARLTRCADSLRRQSRRSQGLSAGARGRERHGVRHPYVEARIDKTAVRALARELGLGALSELPASPCLSSRVETGLAIRAEVLHAIHAVERGIARDFPAATVRCRVRAGRVMIELDPETLAAIAGPREDEARAEAALVFAGIAETADLRFEPYRLGSAFVHSRA